MGLAPELDAETKRQLDHLYHVRNVLVHRRGVADRHLVAECPGLRLNVGDKVPRDFPAYQRAAEVFANLATFRVFDTYARTATAEPRRGPGPTHAP